MRIRIELICWGVTHREEKRERSTAEEWSCFHCVSASSRLQGGQVMGVKKHNIVQTAVHRHKHTDIHS